MAFVNKNDKGSDYGSELRRLKDVGPERLYLIRGTEDYLCEQFLTALKKICIPEEDDGFSYHRIDGPELDINQLREALDAVPFMTERSFIELRGMDINAVDDPEVCLELLGDIPDYSTVAFIQSAGYQPDGRLKLVKELKKLGRELVFNPQENDQLYRWIQRHFADAGKSIDLGAVERLVFISGRHMSALAPEIEKVAAYAKGDKVSIEDVEAVANHIPEAVVFEIMDFISKKDNNNAARLLSELLAGRKSEPIGILATIGIHMRRLYAARLAIDNKLGSKYVEENCGIKDYAAQKLLSSAKGFTRPQLERAVELCAQADYEMKSSGLDDDLLLKELLMRIAAGESDA